MFARPRAFGRRRRTAFVAACAAAALLSACMANPGDAPTVEGDGPVAPPEDAAAASMREIRVGVDDFGDGFNPHLIADASPVTDLVASLTLPSAFEPDPADPGKWRPNPDVLESAELVALSEPVPDADAGTHGDGADGAGADGAGTDGSATVPEADPEQARPGDTRIRYRIHPGAQWSDGTPISGADFRYLQSVLAEQPGVRDAAGYERIRGITVSDGGRQVDVIVEGAMPEWRTLFRHLLPSHILGPSTTPFEDALDGGIPASGSRYSAQSFDVGRGEVRLVRNDRFWGEAPARTETVIIRSIGDAVTGAELLRTGQLQALWLRPRQTTGLTYGLVPGAVEVPRPVPRELVVHANLASDALSDAEVRRMLLSRIDVRAVAAVATGRTDDLGIPPAPASVEAAADASDEEVAAALADAGVEFTDEDPLRIGVMGDDAQAVAAARAVAGQLARAGVPAIVDGASDRDLSASLLPHGRVDLTVAWSSAVDSPLRAQGRWGCPSSTRASLPADSVAGESVAPTSAPSSTARGEEGRGASDGASPVAPSSVARAANLSGLCDERVDELLADAEGTAPPGAEVYGHSGDLDRVRGVVGEMAVELPIVEERMLGVVGAGVRYGEEGDPAQWPVAPYTGPFRLLPEWRRVQENPANGRSGGQSGTGGGADGEDADSGGRGDAGSGAGPGR